MHEVLCLDYSSSQMRSAGEWTDLITAALTEQGRVPKTSSQHKPKRSQTDKIIAFGRVWSRCCT